VNPIVISLAIILTFGFEAILYDVDEFSPGDFPDLRRATPDIDTSACQADGIVAATQCIALSIAQFTLNSLGFIIWLAAVIGYVALWFGNLATLNVEGAHWLGRLMMGASIAGGIGWIVASFTRGTKP